MVEHPGRGVSVRFRAVESRFLRSVFDRSGCVMDNDQKLTVFQAQVENVRALESSIQQVRRSINSALRRNDASLSNSFTKVYAILFCAWAEANFSKVIHTPYGFSLDEIEQIWAKKSKGISAAWKKAAKLGVRHLDARRGSFLPNTLRTLSRAIDAHVFDPTLVRNKLAHGQWIVALNRPNDAIQDQLTDTIRELDIVKVDSWRFCHQHLAEMVESLIESPKKAFVRDWWGAVINLDAEMERSSQRNLADHLARLRSKDDRTGARDKRVHS